MSPSSMNDNNTSSRHSAISSISSSNNSSSSANGISSSSSSSPVNLFDYTEEELLGTNNNNKPVLLTYYEILNLQVYATQDDVKRAYRKSSVRYHPDKSGRGDDDYVFLAVKAAYDTLYDPAKRQAYDSTVLPFDDSIPPPRSVLIQDTMLLYTDEDFYDTFGPVFERNLRFDARLRPDLSTSSNKNSRNKPPSPQSPPTLGDANTPLPEVHKFYEYWIHFESWRDFSAAAADELKLENELENAESRYEKRFYQKEIDKRAKQLKRIELSRVQKLVETAMEADPRLRQERAEAAAAKQRAVELREQERQRQVEQMALQKQKEAEESKRLEEQKAAEKLARESLKKQMRKERQLLRQRSSADYDFSRNNNNSSSEHWDDAYDMNQDVEYLCQTMELAELQDLNERYEKDGLDVIRHLTVERRKQQQEEQQQQQQVTISESKQSSKMTIAANGKSSKSSSSNNNNIPWTKEELSALAKAVKKFPPGGASRWEQICLFVNNLCKQDIPRTKEECIEKYNQVARSSSNKGTSGGNVVTNSNGTKSTIPNNAATDAAATEAVDVWSAEQDQQLQDALAKYPASMDKNERWKAIASAVDSKTKKQCVQRFKAIREALLKNKK